MKVAETYDIQIELDGRELQIDSQQISFKMKNSIWELVPTATLIIDDQSALLHEYLLTVPGTPVTINYGINDVFVKGEYIIRQDVMEQIDSALTLGGKIKIPLVHKWVQSQERKSISFNKRISDIIKILGGDYPFNSLIVNDTENQNTWYQLLKTDIKFIEEILLPRAYSGNSKNTPFFCFIDSFNNFQFRNLSAMLNENVVTTLEYTQVGEEKFNKDIILNVKRQRKKYDEILPHEKINSYGISIDDGTTEKVTNTLYDFSALSNSAQIPYRGNNTVTNWRFYDKIFDIDDTKGERIFKQRNSINIEEFVLLESFNPLLHESQNVNLKFFINNNKDNSEGLSLSQYSGKYLIEGSEKIWDGANGRGYSKIIVTRKGTKYNDNYLLKNKLLS